jgi:glycosyltransferase involved in cell wall biosynthesis
MFSYVLITPARDEEAFIGALIESVAGQTVQPVKHVIVSDGSKDRTDAIVKSYMQQCPLLSLVRLERDQKRTFGSKAFAMKAGYDSLNGQEFAFIGCLDADMTLPPDYYENVIKKLHDNPKLGMAAGFCYEKSGGHCIKLTMNKYHVPGAMQFFRRKCYEDIGGYQPVSVAGVDSLAEILARMKGWETRSFPDITAFHHRKVGSATAGVLRTIYRQGLTDYLLGKRPAYVLLKFARRLPTHPLFLGACSLLAGYFRLWLTRSPRDVSDEVVDFVYREEMQKITRMIFLGRSPF